MALNKLMITLVLISSSSLLSFYAEAKSAPASNDKDSIMEKICRGCQYPADCISKVGQAIPPGSELNSVTAIKAGLNVLGMDLQKAIDATKTLLTQSASKETTAILQECLDTYRKAVLENERTKSAVATEQFSSMESDLSKMLRFTSTIREKLFDKKKTYPELKNLAEVNSDVYATAKNNIGIALDVVKPQHHD